MISISETQFIELTEATRALVRGATPGCTVTKPELFEQAVRLDDVLWNLKNRKPVSPAHTEL